MRATHLIAACLLASAATAQQGEATFELTFASTWSQPTHPIDWPINPHYSGLVGATHDATVHFWQLGGLATIGIKSMAEQGQRSTLRNEINAVIPTGAADQVLYGPGLSTSPGSATFRFSVNARHPRLTLVSMLAPSPDWFVGVDALDLRPNGVWVEDLTIPLAVLDAGTDAGTTYAAANAPLSPFVPIAPLTSGPFAAHPRIIASYRLRRVASSSVFGCGTNPAASMQVAGQPILGLTVGLTLDAPGTALGAPAQTALLVSPSPSAAFPCGTPTPFGELLVGVVIAALPGPAWSGAGVTTPLTVPIDASLAGQRFYLQGALVDQAVRIVLTDAVELVIGS